MTPAFAHSHRSAADFRGNAFTRARAPDGVGAAVLRRRSEKVRVIHELQTRRCAEQLGRLPEPGESWHILTQKNWFNWTIVPATLQLAAPATIDHLAIATLSWAGPFMAHLTEMLDAGTVRTVDLLYSIYFRSHNAELSEALEAECARRPDCRIAADLNHLKLIAMRLTDGRHVVVEGSANLRQCSSREGLVMTADADLYEWHTRWLAEAIDAARGKG